MVTLGGEGGGVCGLLIYHTRGHLFTVIAYFHEALLRQQAAHPDTLIYAYLDDTYACDEPLQAVACMDTGAAVTLEMCNVASNTKKQCVCMVARRRGSARSARAAHRTQGHAGCAAG